MCLRPLNTILGDVCSLSEVFEDKNVVVIVQERQSEAFYHGLSNIAKGKVFKLKEKRYRFDTRKKYFMMSVLRF